MSTDLQSVLIDVALWLYHAFFVPGDQFLSKFPELDLAGHARVVSAVLSTVIWLGAIALIVGTAKLVRVVDRTLAALVVRLYEDLQRAGRVVVRRLAIALRSFLLERQARSARTEVFEQPALSTLQLRILQSHANLPPAHLLTAGDIGRALGMRSADVAVVLGTLRKLSLVDRTLGADDGEDGYRLTKAGEVFLAACSRTPPAKVAASSQRTLRPKRIEPTLRST
jgi:DNA-binding MarR family transcriptional regulator